ncbi:glutamate--cysteine ligase [Methyloceanibacter superfactus]|uniref:Glutamate--cysteine ligase n=1 Tax=Methyloceanibacter superfactus TaxID=1774969 RepID=A0A1E3VY26_9HYPH|nr:glutamate--cysteine ligase [Methyloceanibacter superfactus]ODR97816.1 glutamate--cysteine ligase [Methyloceanibacter superfactus]
MSTRVSGPQSPIIESRDELVTYLEAGSKPESDWSIGTEHEKFGFNIKDHSPVPYLGPHGIGALLKAHHERFGWEPILENGNIIALSCLDCPKGGSISLEPGGQLELSGAPLATIHETEEELRQHLTQVGEVAGELGIGFLGLGFSPKWTLDELMLVPKERYRIMMRYMPTRGKRGLDMMFRTATVQVNMDFGSEADMVRKLRVGLALQPVATALFANSPFTEGKPNGFQSYRAEVWRDTDPDRTGMLPFAFEDGMGFERYVDYALKVPMYFVYRDGRYIDVAGASFEDFMAGKLDALPGVRAGMDDWIDHLTTLFPEVRLKRFIEMRGADAGQFRELLALPGLWTGLLYDSAALDGAATLIADWTAGERQEMRNAVPKLGLATPFRDRTLRDVAREVVTLAQGGLTRRARVNDSGEDETRSLKRLWEILEDGKSPADELLEAYHGPWKGDIDRLFETQAL